MERRLTMASTPIIRYYDHLRFVAEVESRMRDLRRTSESEGQGGDNQQKPRIQRRASRNRTRTQRWRLPRRPSTAVGEPGE